MTVDTTVLTEALLDFTLVWHKINVLCGDLKLSWELLHQHYQLALHLVDAELGGMRATGQKERAEGRV